MMFHSLIFAVFTFILSWDDVSSEMVKMKIIEEPSSYGLQNSFNSFYQPQSETLKVRMKAANFSGPAHLRHLWGKCFTKTDNQYKYKFCPFFNLTQHEQLYRWNPYNGVLGVWQEWVIANNTFKAMAMREGDSCGQDKFRSAKVVLTCAKQNELASVTEPERCEYLVNFTTPLVCHPHAMLVYPRLPESLQQQWNSLLGEVEAGWRTDLGLQRGLQRIFEEAGFYLSTEKRAKLKVKEEEKSDMNSIHNAFDEFYTLDSCTAALRRLKEENEKTKEENKKLKEQIEEFKSQLQVLKNGTAQANQTVAQSSVGEKPASMHQMADILAHRSKQVIDSAVKQPHNNFPSQQDNQPAVKSIPPADVNVVSREQPQLTEVHRDGTRTLQQGHLSAASQQGSNVNAQASQAAQQGSNVNAQIPQAAQQGSNVNAQVPQVAQQGSNVNAQVPQAVQQGSNVNAQATQAVQQGSNVNAQASQAVQQGSNVNAQVPQVAQQGSNVNVQASQAVQQGSKDDTQAPIGLHAVNDVAQQPLNVNPPVQQRRGGQQ